MCFTWVLTNIGKSVLYFFFIDIPAANSVPQDAESDLGLHCLPMAFLGDSRCNFTYCYALKHVLCYLQIRKCQLNAEDTRNLLMCFTWVLKNVDKSVLKQWWTDMPINRLNCILEIIYFTVSNFEYRVCLGFFN